MNFFALFKRITENLPLTTSKDLTLNYDLVMDSAKALRAADSLAAEYIKATEWQLATLSGICMVKKTSKSEIRRQSNICRDMLLICVGLECEHPSISNRCGRVERALKLIREEGKNVQDVIDSYVAEMKAIGS